MALTYSSEYFVISNSRGSSRHRDQTQTSCVSCTGRGILCHCATWEAPAPQFVSSANFYSLVSPYFLVIN